MQDETNKPTQKPGGWSAARQHLATWDNPALLALETVEVVRRVKLPQISLQFVPDGKIIKVAIIGFDRNEGESDAAAVSNHSEAVRQKI